MYKNTIPIDGEETNRYRRNIPLLFVNLILAKNVTTPIVVLFYLSLGFDFVQIGILAAIFQAVDALTQIYGGAIADIYGKKTTQMLYPLMRIAQMLIFAFCSSFAALAVASAIYGLSNGISSGSQHSLLFDTLKVLGKEDEHKKWRGRLHLAVKSVNALAIIAVPFIYTVHARLPFLIGAGLYAVAFVISCFFTEPYPTRKEDRSARAVHRTIGNSFREILGDRRVLWVVIAQAVLLSFLIVTFDYVQPLLKIAGLPVALFGFAYAGSRLVEGLGANAVHTLGRFWNDRKLIILSVGLVSLSFLGSYAGFGAVIVLAVIVMGLSDGMVEVIFSDILNKGISTANRTTIMSVASTAQGIVGAVLALAIGWSADRYGVQGMFGQVLVMFLVIAGILALQVSGQKTHIEQLSAS